MKKLIEAHSRLGAVMYALMLSEKEDSNIDIAAKALEDYLKENRILISYLKLPNGMINTYFGDGGIHAIVRYTLDGKTLEVEHIRLIKE